MLFSTSTRNTFVGDLLVRLTFSRLDSSPACRHHVCAHPGYEPHSTKKRVRIYTVVLVSYECRYQFVRKRKERLVILTKIKTVFTCADRVANGTQIYCAVGPKS